MFIVNIYNTYNITVIHYAISDVLICHQGRLMTGSVGRNLRLWSVVGVGEMRLPGDNNSVRSGGLMMEDEMNLDGAIGTAAFDENLEMVRKQF